MVDHGRLPIGITSMVYWPYRLEEAIARVAGEGYDAIEIWVEHLWRYGESATHLSKVLAQHHLRCSVHCPIMDLNLTSPNRGIRDESVRQTLQAIELTHDLGAELLVVHPGHIYSRKDAMDEFWRLQLDAFEQIVARSEKWGVISAVENMDVQNPEEIVKGAAEIRRITEHFGPGKLGVVMDTTHLNTTENNLEFIAGTDWIAHTHLSDAVVLAASELPTHPGEAVGVGAGGVQTHLPLGEGRLDFPAILAALTPKYKGILSLETFIPQGNPQKIPAQREWLEAVLHHPAPC